MSGAVYITARSRFAALRDAGEGDPHDLMSALDATNFSLLAMLVMGILTVALFLWYFVLRCSDAKEVPP